MSLQVPHSLPKRQRGPSNLLTVAFICLAFLSSCGPGAGQLAPELGESNQRLVISQALSQCTSNDNQVFDEIELLAQKHAVGMSWVSNLMTLRESKSAILNFLSRDQLEARATAILQGPLASRETSQVQDALALQADLKALDDLREHIERFKFLECHMKEYWQMGKIPFKSYLAIEDEDVSRENVINLCSVFKGRPRCSIEAIIADKKNGLTQMAQSYQQRFKQRFFNPRFEMTSGLQAITCTKDEKSDVLNLPVTGDPSDILLLKAAANFWRASDDRIRLNIVESQDAQAIRLTQMASGPSHVDMNKRDQINLGPGHRQPKIVAHELGHILGFPDCYYEAWDKQQHGFIYVELDTTKTNLMCNLNLIARIPDDYFSQLQKTYCH